MGEYNAWMQVSVLPLKEKSLTSKLYCQLMALSIRASTKTTIIFDFSQMASRERSKERYLLVTLCKKSNLASLNQDWNT